jgi:hypothetical protein
MPWKYSGMYSGRMTFSCRTLLASARPAMSSQDTPGLASSISLQCKHARLVNVCKHVRLVRLCNHVRLVSIRKHGANQTENNMIK